MSYKKLDGKLALITGGSNGIGRAICIGLAKEGADIIFTYNTDERSANEVVHEISLLGQNVSAVQYNFFNGLDFDRLTHNLGDKLNKVSVLINNVGTLTRTKFLDISVDEFEQVIKVNLQVPFFLAQQISKIMISNGKGGSIINISSLSGDIARSGVSHYECSKAGINMLTRSMAYALGPYGIRVNTISPGLTATKANKQQREKEPDLWQQRSHGIPLQRTGFPEDYVGAAVYLASDDSAWVTGSKIVIDGGMSIV